MDTISTNEDRARMKSLTRDELEIIRQASEGELVQAVDTLEVGVKAHIDPTLRTICALSGDWEVADETLLDMQEEIYLQPGKARLYRLVTNRTWTETTQVVYMLGRLNPELLDDCTMLVALKRVRYMLDVHLVVSAEMWGLDDIIDGALKDIDKYCAMTRDNIRAGIIKTELARRG